MTAADDALLAELRLLRGMGEAGRAAAALALRSARLGRRSENSGLSHTPATGTAASTEGDPMKLLAHELDAAIVARGGTSIYAARPVGTPSPKAERRLAAWALETPSRQPDTPGRKPKNDRPLAKPAIAPRQTSDKPGRLVGKLTGKFGGYVSDLDGDER